MSMIMIFIFLCFSGLFIMFFCILRGQEKMLSALREELGLTRTQMRVVELRLAALCGEADAGTVAAASQLAHTPSGHSLPGHAQPAPLAHSPLAEIAPLGQTGQIPRPARQNYDPLDSLSMGDATPPADTGLELRFDPQQDFRR